MKKNLISVMACLFVSALLYAQQKDYRVVFDMTSNDTVNQQSLVRQLGLIRQYNPASRLEVVMYGQGLSLVKKNSNIPMDEVQRLLADKNITFKVCGLAMKRQNIDQSALLPGVVVVPDGIYEIVQRQNEGWGYIKVAH